MKRTILDRIDPAPNGILQIRMIKQEFDVDGKLVSQGYHRTSLQPGDDPAQLLNVVNAHLAQMQCGTLIDWTPVADAVRDLHTPQFVADFKAAQSAQQKLIAAMDAKAA